MDRIAFFLAKFFGIFVALYYALVSLDSAVLQRWLAEFTATFLGLPFDGNRILVGAGVFEVNESCTGFVSSILLTAVVFSVKRPKPKQKALIWIVGVGAILLANIARLVSVVWAGRKYGIEAAETAHVLSWIAMSAIVLGFWYYSVKRLAGTKAFEELL